MKAQVIWIYRNEEHIQEFIIDRHELDGEFITFYHSNKTLCIFRLNNIVCVNFIYEDETQVQSEADNDRGNQV